MGFQGNFTAHEMRLLEQARRECTRERDIELLRTAKRQLAISRWMMFGAIFLLIVCVIGPRVFNPMPQVIELCRGIELMSLGGILLWVSLGRINIARLILLGEQAIKSRQK